MIDLVAVEADNSWLTFSGVLDTSHEALTVYSAVTTRVLDALNDF
jgi:hypothetical protein